MLSLFGVLFRLETCWNWFVLFSHVPFKVEIMWCPCTFSVSRVLISPYIKGDVFPCSILADLQAGDLVTTIKPSSKLSLLCGRLAATFPVQMLLCGRHVCNIVSHSFWELLPNGEVAGSWTHDVCSDKSMSDALSIMQSSHTVRPLCYFVSGCCWVFNSCLCFWLLTYVVIVGTLLHNNVTCTHYWISKKWQHYGC